MNEYMKIAKELADSNLESNVGGPFGARGKNYWKRE